MPERRNLIIMAKEPAAGQVKTRLGRDIGMTTAAWWFRHQALRTIRNLRDPRWDIVLALSPDQAVADSKFWPLDLPRVPQGRGDLGTRMARLLRSVGPRETILIGADIPGIRRAHIAEAFAALGRHDAVFGPAVDGGYWLVGLKDSVAKRSGVFSDVRWSCEHTLSDSVESLGQARIAYVRKLRDVDTVSDLSQL